MTSDCPECYGYMSGADWAWGTCPHCGWEVVKAESANWMNHRYEDHDAYQADEAAYDMDCEDAW
jgi:hypothetical protein